MTLSIYCNANNIDILALDDRAVDQVVILTLLSTALYGYYCYAVLLDIDGSKFFNFPVSSSSLTFTKIAIGLVFFDFDYFVAAFRHH